MHKIKPLFVTFEGIEGSGKSYQSRKLFKKIQSMKIPVIYTREPGGSVGAEKIRNILLTGHKNKFTKLTDTLLYLASRNEHYEKTLKPAILKKKNIICDRFIDSTLAYQVYGKKIDKNFVQYIHKKILGNVIPDLTFILKLNVNSAFKRVKKRGSKNRYDRFTMKFYQKIQNAFIKIAKTNKKRYVILDNTANTTKVEKIIFNKFINFYKK